MKKLFLIKEYIKYYFSAKRGGHGVHSPFVFDFVETILEDKRPFYAFDEIKQYRKILYSEDTLLKIEDFGAGSHKNNQLQRKVSEIAKTAGRNERFGKILFRIVDKYQFENIVELGTSLGIATSYLAKANQKANVTTIEGSPEIAHRASKTFEFLQLKNIHQVTGNFDHVLASTLAKLKKVDLFFIDGNHREEPTIQYYTQVKPYLNEHSMVIFDDIHWSEGMLRAWETIKKDSAVTLSIDLFFIGIVLFKKDIKEKQHFVLEY
jgi:predicted O-methyltransferase YrrM